MEVNKIYCCDCLNGLKEISDETIDMVLTSPPYDNLRTYNGYSFDFEGIAKEIYRVMKQGGVVVWVVNDATINRSESGTSFKQALYFKEIGFNLYDTMIWRKDTFTYPDPTRYRQCFEYMFVLSKGKPKTFNPIEDVKNKYVGTEIHGNSRGVDGVMSKKSNSGNLIKEYGIRYNVWELNGEKNNLFNHPAPFPEQLAQDHIITWSNKGDIVLDPFMGSGTTAKMCIKTDRQYIGFEISKEYCEMAEKRLQDQFYQLDLLDDYQTTE